MIGRRVARVVGGLGTAAMLATTLTACGHDSPDLPWAHLPWRAAGLPVPDGSRALVRSATWCGGRWVVAGATADAAGDTRPALWSSRTGDTWRRIRLDPASDYYAAREVLSSVACSHGRLALLGAKSGGVHGTARTATWRQRPDGSLVVVHTSYLLFGGTRAVSVNGLEGGPAGFMIAGTRTSGAAIWTSATGAAYHLHEGVPGLANTPSVRTQGSDVVPARRGGWLVVGVSTDDDGRSAATAWAPAGRGHWLRQVLPGGDTISTANKAILVGSGPLVAGLQDQEFGTWLRQGVQWTPQGTFGETDPDATSAAYVSGLAWTGSLVMATYSDGTQFRLAVGGRRPSPSTLPVSVTVSGDHTVTVATHGDEALLVTDDGRQGRVWRAHVPSPTS